MSATDRSALPRRRVRALGALGALLLLGALDCGTRAVGLLRFDPQDGNEPLVAPSYLELPIASGHEALQLRIRFAPRRRAEILSVFFGLEGDPARDSFDVLRVSARPGIASVLQHHVAGQVETRLPLDLEPGLRELDLEIRLSPKQVSVRANGVAVLDAAVAVEASSVAVTLQPSSPLGRFHAPYEALRRIQAETLAPDGTRRVLLDWRPWAAHPLRFPVLVLVGAGLVAALRRSRLMTQALAGFAFVGLIGPPLVLLVILATSPLTRQDRSDLAAGVRLIGALPDGADDESLRVVALGGSVTHGYPDPARIDPYPEQLSRALARSQAFDGVQVEVTNLGRPTLRLWQIIESFGPVLARDRPDVAILSSVFNNLEEGGSPRLILAQALGLRHGIELAPDAPQLEAYERGLRCFSELTRRNGIATVWLEEFVDPVYFDGRNVLAPLHEVLARVAAEQGVHLLRFQEEVSARPEPLRFYEFIHPTSLGQRWMATSLETWFEARAPVLLAPRPALPPVSPAAIDICRREPLAGAPSHGL